ncbi:MAG TPA: MarR family transcriptional regulator [Pyrodictium sp.]|nr:MarR family transcriptional regulator [Pyrodictium sp.]
MYSAVKGLGGKFLNTILQDLVSSVDTSGGEQVRADRLKCMLKCIFGLSEEEASILAYLVASNLEKVTVKEISVKIGRNPEVVRRALRKLYTKGLVDRQPYPLRRGGRAYVYSPKSGLVETLTRICKEINRIMLDTWRVKVC